MARQINTHYIITMDKQILAISRRKNREQKTGIKYRKLWFSHVTHYAVNAIHSSVSLCKSSQSDTQPDRQTDRQAVIRDCGKKEKGERREGRGCDLLMGHY